MSNNKQPHGFCETPHEKCTMNYCDENGDGKITALSKSLKTCEEYYQERYQDEK